MSARDELPPCQCIDHYPGSYLPDECRSCRALGTLKITREEYTTMRAAVERCAELDTALAKVTAERDEAQHYRANANDIAALNYKEAEGLRAALAKVTAERDAGRERLLCACTYVDLEHNENERDIARLLAVPRYELPALLADALNVNWICRERATPTEGECSECGATSEERGLLPCDMPGCPHAPPTEGE